MNKADLSRYLEEKVQEKLKDGFSILTYAEDAATRDKVKRDLAHHAPQVLHENHTQEEWENYIHQVESGTYQAEHTHRAPDISKQVSPTQDTPSGTATSAGLWKARRR